MEADEIMPKKIKFALEMQNGTKVRTMEELQEHFDLQRVTVYFLNGKLSEWLTDRYYDEKVMRIKELDKTRGGFSQELCHIFDVPYDSQVSVNISEVEKNNANKIKLQQLTADEEILSHVEKTAFSQTELNELLDAGTNEIYLCGNRFTIPIDIGRRSYIGILGKPEIEIEAESLGELMEKEIIFKNVSLPAPLLQVNQDALERNVLNNHKTRQKYHASKILDYKMSDLDRKQAEKFFDVAQDSLGNIVFDIDAGTHSLLRAAEKSEFDGHFDIDNASQSLQTAVKNSELQGGLRRWINRIN